MDLRFYIFRGFESLFCLLDPRVFHCIKWYQSMDSPNSMTQDNGAHTIPIDVDHRVEAIWDVIEKHRLEIHELHNEICNLLADLVLLVNQRQSIVDSNCIGGFTRGQPSPSSMLAYVVLHKFHILTVEVSFKKKIFLISCLILKISLNS